MRKLLILFLFPPLLVFTQELKDFTKEPGYVKYSPHMYGYEHYMPTSTCGEIIHYSNYSVSFCEEYRLSEWAIYYKDIHSDAGQFGTVSRKGLNFIRDPKLNGRDANDGSYYKNPYDKAHLVPAADMSHDYQSLKETFFYTNSTSQHESFNRGGMRELEKKIRQWTKELGTVAIITGWVIEDNIDNYLWVGSPSIPVPNYYYKVFIDIQGNRSVAFLMPNEKITKTLMEYVVSIDYLESVTGLDFFYKLSDEDELSFEIDTGNKK